jgi:predicted DNA-binding transcriptional regulator YafY
MAKRSERLLVLMQALRRRRRPVPGQELAAELGVSLRSVYRDIDALRGLGVSIDGEPGIGFQLRGDTFLPPMSFDEEEIEAIVLGLRRLVYGRDHTLAASARDAMAKIEAVLSPERRTEMNAVGLFALPQQRDRSAEGLVLADMRRALRGELQVRILYRSRDDDRTERVIYPVALGYLADREVLVAWCTLRQDFRSFRIEGVETVAVLDARLPKPRRTLLDRWLRERELPDLT